VEHGYGTAVGEIFLVAAPMGIIAFVAILLLKEVPLGTVSGVEAAAAAEPEPEEHVLTPEREREPALV
jgi:hypothetical protein